MGIPMTFLNHTPGDRAPKYLMRQAGLRGMIGVEEKQKEKKLLWLSYL